MKFIWFFTKSRARNISEAEGRAKMALRVGGGTRSATFETQSEFFRKESTFEIVLFLDLAFGRLVLWNYEMLAVLK